MCLHIIYVIICVKYTWWFTEGNINILEDDRIRHAYTYTHVHTHIMKKKVYMNMYLILNILSEYLAYLQIYDNF